MIRFKYNDNRGTFLMIITRNGNLIPSVLEASAGQVMKLVETLVPIISKTEDWIS